MKSGSPPVCTLVRQPHPTTFHNLGWVSVLLRDVQGSTWASGVVVLAMVCAMAVLHAPLVVR
jgi:hypothetical protein